jgi:hypothetical protein
MLKQNFLHKLILISLSLVLMSSCAGLASYKAYEGPVLPSMQLSVVEGDQYMRREWINRYTDAIHFIAVDGNAVENNTEHSSIEITPGFHDLRVYYLWDLGSQRGLGPALVNYSASRDALSRTLRFNARSGERYTVKARLHFNSNSQDITTLSHVDFWMEDQRGNEIVSRADGRYIPVRQ